MVNENSIVTPELRDSKPSADIGLTISTATVALLLALAIGTLCQGAFYLTGQLAIGAGIAVGVGASVVGRRPRAQELTQAPLPALLALAGWIVGNAAARGSVPAEAGSAALVLAVAAVVFVVRRAPGTDRDVLASVLPMLGTVVAVTTWLGLVLHLPQWGLQARGVWRGAGVLTYPNATAAVLVMLSLLALPRSTEPTPLVGDRAVSRLVPPRVARLMATAMLIGAGATLSRGGLLALAAGLVMAVVASGRVMLRAAPGPLAGAGVGLAGLLPATTMMGGAVTMVALAGAAAGLAVCELVARLVTAGTCPDGHRRRALICAGAALVVGGLGLGIALTQPRLGAVAEARLTTDSTYRVDAARAALSETRHHLLTGVGPGKATVSWHDPDGASRTARYVHNEFLQLLLEHGTVGGVLLLTVVVTAIGAARRASGDRSAESGAAGCRGRRGTNVTWAGGAAATTAFAVHSALDFLWHLPALPLLAATVFAATLTRPTTPATTSEYLPAAIPVNHVHRLRTCTPPETQLEKVRHLS